MPIYEYECEKCKSITEKWQGISEDPLTTCPGCQGLLKKVISRSSFHLKGGGWFADGYSNGKSAPEKATDKANSGESTDSGGKKDTKSPGKNTSKTPDTDKQEASAGA